MALPPLNQINKREPSPLCDRYREKCKQLDALQNLIDRAPLDALGLRAAARVGLDPDAYRAGVASGVRP